MILSNTALSEALADGRLVIEPEPKPVSGSGSPFGTSAVDLRLGAVLAKPKEAPHAIVDMGRAGRVTDTLSAFTEEVVIGDGGYVLEPGPQNLILGHTFEEVRLPLPEDLGSRASGKPALAARIEGKSSRARFGLLVHSPRRPSMPAGPGGSRSK